MGMFFLNGSRDYPSQTFKQDACQFCQRYHSGPCPKIKRVEYYPDGTIKSIEYKEE